MPGRRAGAILRAVRGSRHSGTSRWTSSCSPRSNDVMSSKMHHDVQVADERPVLSESTARRTMTAALRVLHAEQRGAEADLTRAHFARVAPDIALDVVDSGERCLARLAEGSYDAL